MTDSTWIEIIRARGLGSAFLTVLDICEPFGPLAAQLVWALQPVLAIWLPSEAMRELAEALEQPGGIDRLRRQLEE